MNPLQKEPTLRYIRVRRVKPLDRANEGDAGIDFYVPIDLQVEEFMSKQVKPLSVGTVDGIIEEIHLMPGERVLIPSGIKVLLTPRNSMLQANNKSGVATKKGLLFTAEVVDSPYVGEIHIGVVNTSNDPVLIKANEKLVQFIHIPIYLTEPEEIHENLFNQIAPTWGTRGEGAFGSSDNRPNPQLEKK